LLRYLARDAEAYCFRPRDSEAKRRAAVSAARKTPLSCGNRPGPSLRQRAKRRPGERYDTSAYRRAIARACDKAFPHPTLAEHAEGKLHASEVAELLLWRRAHQWAPNRLRHTFATAVRKSHGLEAAQIALGHSSANVTEIYAERDLTVGVELAQAIG
jgi:integrase